MLAVRKSTTEEIESSITALDRLTALIISSLIVIAAAHNIDFVEYFTDDSPKQTLKGDVFHGLQRRDCPKYMKELLDVHIRAYYPQLSLPEEENEIIIEKGLITIYGKNSS